MLDYCEYSILPFPQSLFTLLFVCMCLNKQWLQSLKWLHVSFHKIELKCTELTNAFPLYPSLPNMKLRMNNQAGFFNFSPGITIINTSLNNCITASYLQMTCTDVIIWDLEVITLNFIFSGRADFGSSLFSPTFIHSCQASKQLFIVPNGKTYPVRQ